MNKDLVEAVTRLVGASCPRSDVAHYALARFNEPLWTALEQSGYTTVGVPEEHGGSGGSVSDALAIIRVVGQHAGAVPIAEGGLLGGWLLSSAGWQLPDGPLAVAAPDPTQLSMTREPDGSVRLNGIVRNVAWLGEATTLVLLCDDDADALVCRVSTQGLDVQPGLNLAAEGRDTVHLHEQLVPSTAVRAVGRAATRAEFRLRGAASRVALIAGALERIAEITIRYAGERVQFGRPINQFQAAQHRLALLAAETKLVTSASAALIDAAALSATEVAAAKAVVGIAASEAVAQAHQLHGAIGITREYGLNFFTRRVWSWRSEYGSSADWSEWLGASVAESDDLWVALAGA